MPMPESPLLGEWRAELERQAGRVAETVAAQNSEQIRQAIADLEKALADAREMFSSQLAAKRDEFRGGLKSEFEEGVSRAREILNELDRKGQELHAESEAAVESTSRMAQARLQIEAAEAGRALQQQAGPSQEAIAAESAAANWRERLDSEMAVAQAQWNELLQSSLDNGMQRLSEQLADRSREVLRSAEQKMTERFAELRQPLAETLGETSAPLQKRVELTPPNREVARGLVHGFSRIFTDIPQPFDQFTPRIGELPGRLVPAPLKAGIADIGVEKQQTICHRDQ